MAIVSQGNSVVIDVDATSAIWVKSTGNAEVTVNRGGTPEVSNVTTDVGRFGYYGEPFQLTIRSVTGQAEYQDQQFSIQSLTSAQMGGKADSSATDVALAVNALAESNYSTHGKYSPLWFDATDPDFTVTGTMGSPTIEYNSIAPNGRIGVKVTITAATRIKIDKLTGLQFDGNLFAEIYGTRTLTNVNEFQIEAYEVAGAGEKGWRSVRPTITDPLNNSVEQGGQTNYHYGPHTPLTAFGTSPSATFKMAQFTIRVQPISGTAIFWLFGAGAAAPKRKSRIAIVFDDGWISVATLGAQILLSKGIVFTTAVIPSLIDQRSPNYMTVTQLRSLVSSGCSIIAHGPVNGTGNLIDNYAGSEDPTAARVADIKSTIDWIRVNSLDSKGYDKCYIWPEGKFQEFANDTKLLDGVLAIGVTNSRSTLNVAQNTLRGAYDAQSVYGKLAMPIIGHEAAPTLAEEPAKIAAIIQKINDFSAAGGMDMHLMLHKVLRDEDATDGNRSITILTSGLTQIADAIKAKVDAGELEVVLMQEFSGF